MSRQCWAVNSFNLVWGVKWQWITLECINYNVNKNILVNCISSRVFKTALLKKHHNKDKNLRNDDVYSLCH